MPDFIDTADIAKLIAAPGQPEAALRVLAEKLLLDPGYAMLTILLYDVAAGQGRRIFSSNPESHPAGGYKPIPQTEWGEQVLVRQEIFIAHTVAEFRPHYGDWEMLQDMGLLSGVNLPIIVGGVTIGSVNLTAKAEGYYTPDRVARAAGHNWLAAIALLLEAHTGRCASA